MRISRLYMLLAGALLALGSAATAAPVYDFTRISSNAPDDIAAQLHMEVIPESGYISLKIWNDVGTASSIAQIYVDNTIPNPAGTTQAVLADWYSTPIICNPATGPDIVYFVQGATPASLPGGNNVGFSSDFAASAATPPGRNGGGVKYGVNGSGEWVELNFSLLGGKTSADVVQALNDGSLRVGLHVQSINSNYSDAFISTPVPAPSAALMGGGGLLAVVYMAIRRRLSDR